MNNEEQLLTQPMHRLFIKFTLPALLAMIITGIQGMIDGIFVGNFIGSNAMASVNMAIPFTQLIIGLSMVVSIGTQSYVGLKLGMDDKESARNTFQTLFRFVLILSALISIFGFLFPTKIASFLGADQVLLADTSTYIQHYSIFTIPICLMFYFGFLNRIIGKPELYFIGSILSLLVNISLDYLFIVRLDMGMRGAALATGLAFSSALLVVIWPMIKKSNTINILVGKFAPRSIGPVLYNGSSEGINSFSTAITAYLFNISLMNIAGADGVASFTAINYIGNFGLFLLFGISDGIGPLVSYNYGHGSFQRVKSFMKISFISNFLSGCLIFAVFHLFGTALIGIFVTDNPELVTLAANGGKLYAFAFLFSGFNILASGYFTFIGKGLHSVLIAASRGFIFVSIGILTLPYFFALDGIWLSVPFAELIAALLSSVLLYQNFRKLS